MKVNKKEPKEKKPKKSVSQKITGINTTSSISYGDAEINPKDKRVKWIFGASIIALLAIGIGVPVGLTGAQYISQKPYDKNDHVLGDQTVGDLIDDLDKNNPKLNNDQKRIENIVVEMLYKEERNAFLKFEAFVNNTKYKGTNDKVGSTSFGLDVSKPFNKIRDEQVDKIEIAKKSFRESNPTTWETNWNNELKTNEIYGKAANDKEAIDFMTKEVAKSAAFARFNTAAINTEKWVMSDLNLQATNDIKYLNDEGKEEIIPVGTKLFSTQISSMEENFLTKGSLNNAVPENIDPLTPAKDIKLAVYETKSYVLSQRNPFNNIPKLYNTYFKSANISSVTLPIVRNLPNVNYSWTITKDLLINLFKIVNTKSVGEIIAIDKLSNFKGANTGSNETNRDIDKMVINTLSEDSSSSNFTTSSIEEVATTGSNLGSSKVTSLPTLMKEEENESRAFNMAAISSSITPNENSGTFKIKQSDPIRKFLELILSWNNFPVPGGEDNNLQSFFRFVQKWIKIDENNIVTFTPGINESNFQETLKNFVTNISTEDFNSVFGNLLTKSFEDTVPYPGLTSVNNKATSWTVYQLGNPLNSSTYLYVDDKGMKVYNVENVNGESAKLMLKSDIQNTLSVLDNPDKVVLYGIADQYNKIANNNIINKILIEEKYNDILNVLVNPKLLNSSSKETPLTDEEAKKLIAKVDKLLVEGINNIINPEIKSAMTNIPTLIDTFIASTKSYDFFVNDNPNEINEIKFMNGVDYKTSLIGKRKIYTEIWNKLNALMIIKVEGIKK